MQRSPDEKMSIDCYILSLRLLGMNVGKRLGSAFLVLVSLMALNVGHFGRALAADRPASSLDDYLKKLGYEGIAFKNTEDNKSSVQGEINGKKRGFIVDTGWGLTTLNKTTARDCKTPAEMGVALEDSILGTITNSSIVIMEKLVLGRAQFLNQPADVMKLKMDFIGFEYDGILGCDFFLRNFCLIDCGGRRLYVRAARPSEQQSNALAQTLRQSGFGEVPLRQKGFLTLEAIINEQSVVLAVDTGSFASVLDQRLVKPLRLSLVKEGATGSYIKEDLSAEVIGVGGIGAHKLRVATLKQLKIGPRTWQNVHFGVADLGAWGVGKPGTPGEHVQGWFAAEMLASHGALIDFASGTLWFCPEKKK